MTELRSGPSCRGNERFVDQYGDGDTGRYADHYGGSRGKNDTCGCGESARERDERRACGCSDTSKYATTTAAEQDEMTHAAAQAAKKQKDMPKL